MWQDYGRRRLVDATRYQTHHKHEEATRESLVSKMGWTQRFSPINTLTSHPLKMLLGWFFLLVSVASCVLFNALSVVFLTYTRLGFPFTRSGIPFAPVEAFLSIVSLPICPSYLFKQPA